MLCLQLGTPPSVSLEKFPNFQVRFQLDFTCFLPGFSSLSKPGKNAIFPDLVFYLCLAISKIGKLQKTRLGTSTIQTRSVKVKVQVERRVAEDVI